MYSIYSKYEPMRMGSFMGGRPTAKSIRQTRPVRNEDMHTVESLFQYHYNYRKNTLADSEMKYIHDRSNVLQERIQKKDKKNITAIEKMIYSEDTMLFLILKRKLIADEIQARKREFYASPCAKDKEFVRKFQE